jgi:hypothetical protein
VPIAADWLGEGDHRLFSHGRPYRADNCAAFTACGGTAIRWKMGASDISEVVGALKSWL